MAKYSYEAGKTYISDTEPTEIVLIPAGGYRYKIEAEGYDPIEGRVDAIQGVKELNIQMTLTVYSLSVTTVTGGSVKASASTATMGQVVTLIPTAAEGYHFSSWDVRKADGTVLDVQNNQFVMPASDVVIGSRFDLTVFDISVASGILGGTISASASTAVMDTVITLTASPSTGYELASWTVTTASGAVVVSDNKFTMPPGDVNVSATFSLIDYSITVNQVEGGTISASASTAVMGTVITLSATAAAYYEFTAWAVSTSQGQIITVSDNKFTMPADTVTVTAVWTRLARVVGYALDRSLMSSDPTGCLTYLEECAAYTPMSNPSNANADEGSWADTWPFNVIKPVVLNGDGSVYKYLSKGNISLYEDGTSSTSELASSSYDTFVEIPTIYYKVVKGDTSSELYLSDAPGDGFTAHPAFIVDGEIKPKIYIGRYLAYLTSSKLYSRSGVTATASTTRPTFRTAAQARGDGFNLISYYDWMLLQQLFVLAFKSLHGQSVLGAGRTNASSYASNGGSNTRSWIYGSTSATAMMSFLGIENFWGEKYWFIDNFVNLRGTMMAGTSSTPNDAGTGYDTIHTRTSNISGYPGTCSGGELDFFIGLDTSGSATTGLCDYQYLYADGDYLAFVGGSRSTTTYAGPFYLSASTGLSASSAYVGSRLAYKP